MPEQLDEALFQGWIPYCFLFNMETNLNLVDYCELNSTRRIKITILINNTLENDFILIIKGIPTPIYETIYMNAPFV